MQDNFNLSASRAAKNEKAVWERRFWEHLIRDTKDLNRHIDYIHFNPVKHGLDSSFGDYVAQGVYPAGKMGTKDPWEGFPGME